ncbi:MAG: hypothetical protein LAO51_09875 [Acidobacteriia bacterium]|nr:hypothetical protein [Terriglobia bacterium]
MFANARRFAGLTLCIVAAACGGGSSGSKAPAELDPTGDWSTTWTVASNPCNLDNPDVQESDTRITRQGDNALLQAEGEACSPATAPYDSSVQAFHFHYAQTDPIVEADGCTYSESRTTDLIITESSITGTDVLNYVRLLGSNCTFIPQPSCGLLVNVAGQRCQGCYGGCTSTAMGASPFRLAPPLARGAAPRNAAR